MPASLPVSVRGGRRARATSARSPRSSPADAVRAVVPRGADGQGGGDQGARRRPPVASRRAPPKDTHAPSDARAPAEVGSLGVGSRLGDGKWKSARGDAPRDEAVPARRSSRTCPPACPSAGACRSSLIHRPETRAETRGRDAGRAAAGDGGGRPVTRPDPTRSGSRTSDRAEAVVVVVVGQAAGRPTTATVGHPGHARPARPDGARPRRARAAPAAGPGRAGRRCTTWARGRAATAGTGHRGAAAR